MRDSLAGDRPSGRAWLDDAMRLARRPAPGNRRPGAVGWIAALLIASLTATGSQAIAIDWVTVGDPGNAADTSPAGYGAVAESFRIMKYEFTNSQYTAFLNSVAATDTYGLYNTSMGLGGGGITRNGSPGTYSYAVQANMGDRPVGYVSWFDAARVANWLMNGATSSSSTETGAYTLGGATSGIAPARNAGATVYIPTENQWYKAAYYKGGSTNAGYWDYATQSDSAPMWVTKDSNGNGSAGSTGNFANYEGMAHGVSTVGTNGGPSVYGAFDMTGNSWEWNDLTGAAGSYRGGRGGSWDNSIGYMSSGFGASQVNPTDENNNVGFRLVSSVPSSVPEVDPAGLGSLIALVTGALGLIERRRSRRA